MCLYFQQSTFLTCSQKRSADAKDLAHLFQSNTCAVQTQKSAGLKADLNSKGMASCKERGWADEEDQVANDAGQVQHNSPRGIDWSKMLLREVGFQAFLPKSVNLTIAQ